MATRLDGLATEIRDAHIAAHGAMIGIGRWDDPALLLGGVVDDLAHWSSRLEAASDIVDRRVELAAMLTAIAGAGGMESVRQALRAELEALMEATVIDEVAPVVVSGPTTPSRPNAGPDTNSEILHGDEGTFEDEDGTLVELYGNEVTFAVAVEREIFDTAIGDFTFSAVGADGEAGYWVGVSSDGVEIGASAGGEAHLVQGEYTLDTAYLDAGAQVSVGAEAELVGAIEFQPFEGDLNFEAGGEVGASISAGVEGQLGTDDLNVSGGVGAGFGAGAEANVDVGFDDWTFQFDTELGAYLGLGVEIDFGFEVDVVAVGSGILDFFNPGWAPWN